MDLNGQEIKEKKSRLEEKFYNLEVLGVEKLEMSFNATSWDRYLISLEAKKISWQKYKDIANGTAKIGIEYIKEIEVINELNNNYREVYFLVYKYCKNNSKG